MTLIIGCITPEFAIIGGDTQLSSGDLNRGNIKRSTQIKISMPSKDFMFGILGKWSWYYPNKDGSASKYVEDKYLFEKIQNHRIDDKLKYLRDFIKSRNKLDATTIYVKANKDNFELDSISTSDKKDDDNHEAISRLNFDGIEYLFNESFYKTQSNYVENIILELREKHNLTNTLADTIFLINNTILKIISKGENVNVIDENGKKGIITNSVGGYVTIQIMHHTQLGNYNNLFMCYRHDYNCLLDNTTNPFAKAVDSDLKIRYIDNLAMLINNYISRFQDKIKDVLLETINNQINLIISKDIVESEVMNELIEFINSKHGISIDKLEAKSEEKIESVVDIDIIFPSVVEDNVDLNYLKRFF